MLEGSRGGGGGEDCSLGVAHLSPALIVLSTLWQQDARALPLPGTAANQEEGMECFFWH